MMSTTEERIEDLEEELRYARRLLRAAAGLLSGAADEIDRVLEPTDERTDGGL